MDTFAQSAPEPNKVRLGVGVSLTSQVASGAVWLRGGSYGVGRTGRDGVGLLTTEMSVGTGSGYEHFFWATESSAVLLQEEGDRQAANGYPVRLRVVS